MMPNISGIDFLRDFRIKDKNTPVLMLTANSQITKRVIHMIVVVTII